MYQFCGKIRNRQAILLTVLNRQAILLAVLNCSIHRIHIILIRIQYLLQGDIILAKIIVQLYNNPYTETNNY